MPPAPDDPLIRLAERLAQDAHELIDAANTRSERQGNDAAGPVESYSEQLLSEARAEADRLIQVARRAAEESERVVAEARLEADRLLRDAQRTAEEERAELTRELQARVAAVRHALAMASSGLDRLLETAVRDPNRR